ncbi:MAG TPA: LysE family translocator [Gaiellaceae bacterium]
MLAQLAAFCGISALVIVTPGQDTALTIRNALLGGRPHGIATALGVSSGQALWALATSLGLAAVLRASEPAFVALRFVGAAYLVYLGCQSLLRAWRRSGGAGALAAGSDRPRPLVAYRQGVLSNLGNPKMAIFFTSLLPQFGASFGSLLALGLLFSVLTLLWLGCNAAAVARAGAFLRRPRIQRALDCLSGLVLVALGLRLAAERLSTRP